MIEPILTIIVSFILSFAIGYFVAGFFIPACMSIGNFVSEKLDDFFDKF